MAEYRRLHVAGGTYFFTVVTSKRLPIFAEEVWRKLLGDCLRECASLWPFRTEAIVLLPDHLHALWTLPKADPNYSRRWGWTKKEFTKRFLAHGGVESVLGPWRQERKDRGVWQPRFRDHLIRDEYDFENHFHYIHYNPVKHGLAARPLDWEPSSFHRWVREGLYPENWGCAPEDELRFGSLVDAE